MSSAQLLVRTHAQLDERAVAGGRLLDMQEPLLFGAARRRLKHHVDREPRERHQRIGVYQQPVVDSVERDRGADVGRRPPAAARDGHGMTADAFEVVQSPDDRATACGDYADANDQQAGGGSAPAAMTR